MLAKVLSLRKNFQRRQMPDAQCEKLTRFRLPSAFLHLPTHVFNATAAIPLD
jgi:hypothetical protein